MAFNKTGKGSFGPRSQKYGRNSDRSSGFGPKPGFGGKSGGRSFGKPAGKGFELFDTQCANCGKDTQVPFKPTSGKPVYCRDCFTKGGDDARPKKGFSRDRSDELAEINEKLDKIMRALKID